MHWMRKQSLFFVAWTLLVGLSTASMVAVANTSKDAAQGPLVGTRFDESAEAEIAATVKARAYAGGQDEEDLKVQKALPKTPRKLGPTTEIAVPPANSDGF